VPRRLRLPGRRPRAESGAVPAVAGPPPPGTIRLMPGGFHPPLEEYLEAILALEEEGVAVIQARLAERLGHSAQAVSETVRRLCEAGLLRRAGRGITLTPEGRRRAEKVVRKHRLAERFLVDVVGLPWHQAHEEAGRWEHVISDEVEQRFDVLLGHPTTCPHGNPIPGAAADLSAQHLVADATVGESVRLARITERVEIDGAALVWLSGRGLVPGRRARVSARSADGEVTLMLGDEPGDEREVTLDRELSHQLYVEAV